MLIVSGKKTMQRIFAAVIILLAALPANAEIPVIMRPPGLPHGTIGIPYAEFMGVMNSPTSCNVVDGALPPGLTFDLDGVNGRFYPDVFMGNYVEYRDVKEFGDWILEFNSGGIGQLDKVVPHIYFKKFAQSCWSELCEIYGIPPRVMKTDTRDPAMLARAETMMKEVGAAAWFIIDTTEEFDFAKAVATNGDVYANLINLCNNELSMLVTGAIIGQDTRNGNESKEKVSISLLDRLVNADNRMAETYMNSVVKCFSGLLQASPSQ